MEVLGDFTCSNFLASKRFKPKHKKNFQRLHLIQSSFSSKKVSRQFPLLAGLHTALDGALFGVVISVVLMSTLALHWRYLWTVAFTRLEITRDLSHRLVDSTAMLERNMLQRENSPLRMRPTKAEDLIFLENPFLISDKSKNKKTFKSIFNRISFHPINYGY